ncbi:N-acetylmuramoyl-L-alanine amidase family protein [Hallella bergensis]|uniref:N-acetylmuramoyl-L-alanine amidase family protein n=1 Tax=Hallella bergensis TaxID=242750 RepID=UPI003990765E
MFRRLFTPFMVLLMFALTANGADKRFKLVIDAGHGGKDQGAPGAMSKEKDLTLKYVLSLGRMIERNCPDVKVFYTRKSDQFVALKSRADFANSKKADLFISIHINAVPGNRLVRGFQSYTLGRGQRTGNVGILENLDVAKRENSVIYLEDNYKTVYKGFDPNSVESDIMFEFIADKNRERSVELSRLMQAEVCAATGRRDAGSHQNNLAVLRWVSMPAVLLELGFISTPDEEQFLNSEAGLDCYTKGIYNAFVRYKNKYDNNIRVPYRSSKTKRTAKVVAVRPPQTQVTNQSQEKAPQNSQQNQEAVAGKSVKKKAVEKKIDSPTGNADQSKPVFKVQIFASRSQLKAGDPNFKGLVGCDSYEEGEYKKYTYGASNDYNMIYRLRKEILDRFPECFIIAFKDGKKINVNEGIREFKANR